MSLWFLHLQQVRLPNQLQHNLHWQIALALAFVCHHGQRDVLPLACDPTDGGLVAVVLLDAAAALFAEGGVHGRDTAQWWDIRRRILLV